MKVRLVNFHCLVTYADTSGQYGLYEYVRQVQINKEDFSDLFDLVTIKPNYSEI